MVGTALGRPWVVAAVAAGGAAPHAEVPARFLVTLGAKMTLIVHRRAFWPKGLWEQEGDATEVVELGSATSRSEKLALQGRLAARLAGAARRGADLVAGFGSPITPALLLARCFSRRPVLTYHTQDFLEPGRYPWREVCERWVARRAGLVCSNEINRARILQSLWRLPVPPVVVPTGLPREWPFPARDLERRRAILGENREEASTLVLHAGGFSPVRCTEKIIRAAASLDSRFVLAFTASPPGSESRARIESIARETGVAGRVVCLPFLSYPELLGLIASADIGLLLYPNDGIGNFYQRPGRLTEYVGCGIPIVTSCFPGLKQLVTSHGLGAVCDPEDPAAIAAAIERVGSTAESQPERNTRLREVFRTSLCFEAGSAEYEHAWRRLLSRATRGRRG